MPDLRSFYPEIAPYCSGRLRVSDLHELHFEEAGNPAGKPVIVLHGGPGGGITPFLRRLHDPAHYRIVLFDQRGCGRSMPLGELQDNTTGHLVADMEKLRTHLGIGQWLLFGGSWGSTLALAYGQAHPERCLGFVLRGIFLLRPHELRWFYQEGASFIFPDEWEGYLAPIPPATLALMSTKGVSPADPILMRAYKKESEIELWKRGEDGKYALLKTYPMCRWSGQLGPKIREGDRQAPEGFYAVTPASMNPNSSLYLSFNLGYPNEYDRSLGRTGAHLMVHGSCSSRGCFAMTDEAISELYAVVREAFAGGQRAVQFQSYPFRMTPENLARHRQDPNIAFWRNIKEGSDRFEITKAEPVVGVAGGRYVFDADADGATAATMNHGPAPRRAASAASVKDGRSLTSRTCDNPAPRAMAARFTPPAVCDA